MGKQSWKAGNMLYPVPAVMVSCQRIGEKPNIITAAWAGTICSDPAMLSVSIRKERYSYGIIKETKEFVVNLVTKELVYAADMKLTPQKMEHINAPGILQSPVNLECVVKDIISLGSHDMFLAEIAGVTVDDRYMDKSGKFHLNDAGLTAYSHGEYYELGNKIGTFGFSVKRKK